MPSHRATLSTQYSPAIPRNADGATILGAGLGRPLIVTTLEPAEAMRLLAVGHRDTTRAVAILLAIGVTAIVVGIAWLLIDAVL